MVKKISELISIVDFERYLWKSATELILLFFNFSSDFSNQNQKTNRGSDIKFQGLSVYGTSHQKQPFYSGTRVKILTLTIFSEGIHGKFPK